MTTPIDKLVHELSKLPTVGEKTALRLALHILRQPTEYGQRIAKALHDTVGHVRFCSDCYNICTDERCGICVNASRDSTTICVVEDIADLQALEKSASFRGLYHVLHGALSPIDGIGPEELRIRELVNRVRNHPEIREVILATNPNVNGDATSIYISRLLKPLNTNLTKLASGIPVGGHIEFIDQNTLSRALERRVQY